MDLLFRRIQECRSDGNPLTEECVDSLRVRRDRIAAGLESLVRGTGGRVQRLKDLPDGFEIPTTKSTAEALQETTDTGP